MSEQARSLGRRILLSAILATAMFLWASHHFDLGFIVLIVGTVVAVLKFAQDWISDKDKKEFTRSIRRGLLVLVDRDFLIVVTLLFVGTGSAFSSIRTYGDGIADAKDVSVRIQKDGGGPLHEIVLEKDDDVGRQWLMPGLFGASYTVEVPGYRRASFVVYPWRSTRVRLTRDLKPLPTIFVRVEKNAQASLHVGKIQLLRNGQEIASAKTSDKVGAAMFGRRREIPANELMLYELQARVHDDTTQSPVDVDPLRVAMDREALHAEYLLKWLNPAHAPLTAEVFEGETLEVVYSAANQIRARAEVVVEGGDFLDVLLSSD